VIDLINLYDVGSKNTQGIFKLPGNAQVNVTADPKAKEKLKLKIDMSTVEVREGEQVPSTPVSQRMADRKMSRRTSAIGKEIAANDSPENNSPNNQHARRQSYTIQESPVEVNDDELFTLKFKMVMDKLDCNENQAALLELVTNSHEDESDAIAQAHLRLHAKDLCDILARMLNTLTEHNKVILMITEVQYIDTLSWDLLLELAVNCPRLAIFSFGRPESTFESKENRRIYRLIAQLPRTKSLSLNGLTAEETITLIMCTWNGHYISGVDPKIADSIYKRTDGNPFFIRSLVMALKESGQWRVNPSGLLTTPDPNFDFDKLVLGYDNQNIVLAQFDRLDRNFQLFLKVASVLGLKFALDDVLYFLTGFADAGQHIDRKKYNQIIAGLQATDKYQFLQKEAVGPDGAYFQFKSALVRKCIYSMMVHNQRQQIHLLVARYLESKMNEQNRHRYVVQVLDHYMNSASAYKNKCIHYTDMAANYFFEKENPAETIKYCKQLLELIGEAKPADLAEISSLQIANFHRELGYALMMKDELDEAEEHLIKSLKIMGQPLPPAGYKFNWALKSQISKRKKLDKTFFKDRPVPQEEDYTQSYVARKGASGYSLSNLVTATAAVARVQGIL
jgi:tetratricopeptide (TPR) repeat protein